MPHRSTVPAELTSGVFTVADARRAGLTWKQLQGAAWRRIGDGLYAWSRLGESPNLLLAAVQRSLPADAVFSGQTAAWLHCLDLPPCDPIADLHRTPDAVVAQVRSALAYGDLPGTSPHPGAVKGRSAGQIYLTSRRILPRRPGRSW